MKNTIFLLVLLLVARTGFTQTQQADPKYKLISGDNYVQSKNYYLLTLLNEIPAVKLLLKNDQVFSKLAVNKRAQMAESIKNCANNLQCYTSAVKFSNEEIGQAGSRLAELYQENNALGKLVKEHLVPSGCYSLYAGLDNKQLLTKAWEQDAKAVNYTIGVYAEGNKPNYPQIDSIAFKVRQPGYLELVTLNAQTTLAETEKDQLFYTPTLVFALKSLEINERNQAGDYEPMTETVNKAAVDYAKKLDWNKYKYTLILVPGAGPDEKEVALSAGGMLRCRLAAIQYEKGLAPFIMVSGGCVHPYKTKYNEAIEMKKFMMQTLHIPEKAILLEPHARHTTTNLRNCVRQIFRYGFPMDKPCITSTAKSQSTYITGVMLDRCQKELGYVPYKNGSRLSDTEAEFYPLAVSLQLDFDEPMDP